LLRTLVVLSVLGGSTIAAKLGVPPDLPAETPVRPAPAAAQPTLPGDWRVQIRPHVEGFAVRMERGEVEALLGIVDRSAKRFGLDPLLVLAVIQVESQFDRFAVSPKGAMGLMQVRADTAKAVAEDLGLAWESEQALFDPETNVLLGTKYLRTLLDRFGSLDPALVAFHAGPGFVESRLKRAMPVSLAYPDRVWDAVLILEHGVA
jgi:soluble lytic murein transglycosylase-like protein